MFYLKRRAHPANQLYRPDGGGISVRASSRLLGQKARFPLLWTCRYVCYLCVHYYNVPMIGRRHDVYSLQYGVSLPVEMKYLAPGAWFGLAAFRPIMAHPASFSLHEKHLPWKADTWTSVTTLLRSFRACRWRRRSKATEIRRRATLETRPAGRVNSAKNR